MKKYIIGFILGAIVFGSIGTVIAATIFAKDISYTPKDTNWKVNNVEDAINELYSKSNANNVDVNNNNNDDNNSNINFGEAITKEILMTSSTTTKNFEIENLKKGKYLLIESISTSWTSSSSSSSASTDSTIDIYCANSNCTTTIFSGKNIAKNGTSKKDGYWVKQNHKIYTYYLELLEDDTVFIPYVGNLDNASYPMSVYITLIPIS